MAPRPAPIQGPLVGTFASTVYAPGFCEGGVFVEPEAALRAGGTGVAGRAEMTYTGTYRRGTTVEFGVRLRLEGPDGDRMRIACVPNDLTGLLVALGGLTFDDVSVDRDAGVVRGRYALSCPHDRGTVTLEYGASERDESRKEEL